MIGNKFFNLFLAASDDTQQLFLKYLNAQKSKSAQKLHKVIKDSIGESTEKRTMVIERLTQKNGNPQVRNFFSAALNHFYDFIVIHTTRQNPELKDYVLSTYAKNTGNQPLTSLLIQKSRNQKKDYISPVDKVLSYEIQKEYYSEEYDISFYLSQLESINRYTLIEKMRIYVEIFKFNSLSSTEISLNHKKDAISLIEYCNTQEATDDEVALGLTIDFLLTQSPSSIDTLLIKKGGIINRAKTKDASLILRSLFEFSVTRMNEGQRDYETYIQKIINIRLDLVDQKLTEFELRNYILFLCRKGEVNRSRRLLDKVIANFDGDQKENILNLNLATIFSYQNKPEQAIEHLSLVDQSSSSNYLMSKFRLIKIYYDMNQYLALDNLLASFRTYLAENKDITLKNKNNTKSFLKAISTLAKLQQSKGGKSYDTRLHKLKNIIDNKPGLINRRWFINELSKLSNQTSS